MLLLRKEHSRLFPISGDSAAGQVIREYDLPDSLDGTLTEVRSLKEPAPMVTSVKLKELFGFVSMG